MVSSFIFFKGIDSIGISDTTLEEIFIKIASDANGNQIKEEEWKLLGFNLTKLKQKIFSIAFRKNQEVKKKDKNETLNDYSSYTKLRVSNRPNLIFQQLYALLIKRFHRVKRNRKGFVAEIIVPIVFVCIALLVATLTPKNSSRPALELHPWYYPIPNRMFLSKSSSFQYDTPIFDTNTDQVNLQLNVSAQSNYERVKQVTDTFFSSPGPGTRCMNGHQILIPQSSQDISRSQGSTTLQCSGSDAQLVSNYSIPSSEVISQLNRKNFSYTKLSPDCDCSSGFPICSNSAGGDIPNRPISVLKTLDYIYDLSGRNVTDWLVKTELSSTFYKKRFGGFEFIAPTFDPMSNLTSLLLNYSVFAQSFTNFISQITQNLNSNSSVKSPVGYLSNVSFVGSNALNANETVKIWYNTKGYDSSVSYLNVLNNAFLRSKTKDLNINPNDYGESNKIKKNGFDICP